MPFDSFVPIQRTQPDCIDYHGSSTKQRPNLYLEKNNVQEMVKMFIYLHAETALGRLLLIISQEAYKDPGCTLGQSCKWAGCDCFSDYCVWNFVCPGKVLYMQS